MTEYVSKDAVKQMLGNRYGGFLLELDAMPAADVVPVVRCKDCKYLTFSDGWGVCGAGYLGRVVPNDFCSHGEREENKNV